MRVLIATVWLLAGCDKLFTLTHVDDPAPGSIDAGADADAEDMADAAPCAYGELGKFGGNDGGLYRACLSAPPHGDYVLPTEIDTKDLTSCSERANQDHVGAQDVCLISAANIVVDAPTRVFGNLPLVLVATGTITISSSLDASSLRGAYNGPGNNHSTCSITMTENGAPGSATVGAGGGAGGSFQTKGGRGGIGEGGASAGGVPDGVATLSYIRGGCGGGDGGLGGAMSGGNGGVSGGAVYLIAGTSITLGANSLVNASGAGGAGGGKGAMRGGGGGGGGSGGLIAFDSPQVTILAGAHVIANGGGGGGSGGVDTSGENGQSAAASPAPFDAPGGTTITAGGSGATVAAPASVGIEGASPESGGGGGGGAGFIKIYTTSLTLGSSDISPSPN